MSIETIRGRVEPYFNALALEGDPGPAEVRAWMRLLTTASVLSRIYTGARVGLAVGAGLAALDFFLPDVAFAGDLNCPEGTVLTQVGQGGDSAMNVCWDADNGLLFFRVDNAGDGVGVVPGVYCGGDTLCVDALRQANPEGLRPDGDTLSYTSLSATEAITANDTGGDGVAAFIFPDGAHDGNSKAFFPIESSSRDVAPLVRPEEPTMGRQSFWSGVDSLLWLIQSPWRVASAATISIAALVGIRAIWPRKITTDLEVESHPSRGGLSRAPLESAHSRRGDTKNSSWSYTANFAERMRGLLEGRVPYDTWGEREALASRESLRRSFEDASGVIDGAFHCFPPDG